MIFQVTCSDYLRKKRRREKVTLVDIRSRELYDRLHIPGAIHVALEALRSQAPQYVPDRGAQVVIYGSDDSPGASVEAAGELESLGYVNVFACTGGFDCWRQDGQACEASVPEFRLNFL